MRYSIVVPTLLALAAGAPTAAQTVSGQLLDTDTRQPIAAATMSLLRDDSALVSVVTDSAGGFVLRAPKAGSYRLRAGRIGYRAAETPPLELAAGDTLRVEFRLSVAAVALNPITVVGYSRRPSGELGGFYDRMRRGLGGQFVTREQIDERMPIFTTDLLRTMAGVSVTPSPRGSGSIVRLRGGCIPSVYLDGVPIGLLGMTIDDLIQPMNLEGIELYRGPAETPVEFARNACGAIVLWTRRGS
jgi:hypothetical protein